MLPQHLDGPPLFGGGGARRHVARDPPQQEVRSEGLSTSVPDLNRVIARRRNVQKKIDNVGIHTKLTNYSHMSFRFTPRAITHQCNAVQKCWDSRKDGALCLCPKHNHRGSRYRRSVLLFWKSLNHLTRLMETHPGEIQSLDISYSVGESGSLRSDVFLPLRILVARRLPRSSPSLIGFLLTLPNLEKLDLSGSHIQEIDVTYYLNGMSNNLSVLCLRDVALGEAAFAILLAMMTSCPSLRHLDLSRSLYKIRSGPSAALILDRCGGLVSLNLAGNGFNVSAVANIAEALKWHKSLESLVLNGNFGCSGAINSLSKALSTNKVIKSLSLRWCGLRNESLFLLGGRQCEVDISGNSMINWFVFLKRLPDVKYNPWVKGKCKCEKTDQTKSVRTFMAGSLEISKFLQCFRGFDSEIGVLIARLLDVSPDNKTTNQCTHNKACIIPLDLCGALDSHEIANCGGKTI